MPLLELKLLEIQFSALSPTCFDILSWNFAHDFVLMYYRSSLSVINLCQVLLELCPFWNLKYCKYTVFRTFLLHALTYWVEILHMTLFYCTTDQVRVSSIFVWVMPLLELRILKIHSFPHFLCPRHKMARGHLVFALSVIPSFRPSVIPSFCHSVIPSHQSLSSQLLLHPCMDLNETWYRCCTTSLEVRVGR